MFFAHSGDTVTTLLDALLKLHPEKRKKLSVADMADMAFCSERSVQRSLKKLQDMGVIKTNAPVGRGTLYSIEVHEMAYLLLSGESAGLKRVS